MIRMILKLFRATRRPYHGPELDKDKVYRDLKALSKYPEWTTFAAHIRQNIVPGHKDAAVDYLAKNEKDDAQRQAWICEGLLEALEEPQAVVDMHIAESGAQKVCALCGTVTANFLRRVKQPTQ